MMVNRTLLNELRVNWCVLLCENLVYRCTMQAMERQLWIGRTLWTLWPPKLEPSSQASWPLSTPTIWASSSQLRTRPPQLTKNLLANNNEKDKFQSMLLGINHLRPCCELNKHIKSESPEFWMHRKLNIQHVLPKLNYQSMGNCSDNHHHNLCCGVRQGP